MADSDRERVSAVLVLEAGGEGPLAMQAVLNVIAHRAGGDPGRAVAVVLKPRQFAVVSVLEGQEEPDWSPILDRAEARFAQQLPIARELVARWEAKTLEDITGGCRYFVSVGTARVWMRTLEVGPVIGRLQFYRDPV